jgi:hypothetical protein
MRNYCDHEKINLEIFADLRVFIPLEYEKVFLMASTCLHAYISVRARQYVDTHVASARTII